MPISAMPSGSARTHSWDLVYLRSDGTLLMKAPRGNDLRECEKTLAVTHEGRPHDAGAEKLAADVDGDALAGCRWYAGERDRALECRRIRAARDFAGAGARDLDLLVAAQHAAILEHEPHELALHSGRALCFERRATV